MSSHIFDEIGSSNKRKRRTAEMLAEDYAKRDAKRIAREKDRNEKEEDRKRKQVERAVRQQIALKAKSEKAPRFTWTTAATEELLQLVAHLKNEHDSVLEANPGFITWGKFFKDNAARKEAFETLKDVPFDALDRRYKVICNTYKTVRDLCAETGGAGMLEQLAKYNMSQSVYDAIWELHRDNDAMNAVGGADISDMNDLFNAPLSPYMSDMNDLSNAPFELSGSDSDIAVVTPLSASRKQGIQKPPILDNKVGRKKGKGKETGVDEGMTALMRMQVESQERMERWSLKLEEQREKIREDREARRAVEREEEREDRAQERKNAQVMNLMMMTMLAKISSVDMSQLNSQAK